MRSRGVGSWRRAPLGSCSARRSARKARRQAICARGRRPGNEKMSRAVLALAVAALAARALGFVQQRAIEALLGLGLEGTQAGKRLVEITPLVLELADALGNPLEPAAELGRPGFVGLVEAQILADRVDGESQPPQPLD